MVEEYCGDQSDWWHVRQVEEVDYDTDTLPDRLINPLKYESPRNTVEECANDESLEKIIKWGTEKNNSSVYLSLYWLALLLYSYTCSSKPLHGLCGKMFFCVLTVTNKIQDWCFIWFNVLSGNWFSSNVMIQYNVPSIIRDSLIDIVQLASPTIRTANWHVQSG